MLGAIYTIGGGARDITRCTKAYARCLCICVYSTKIGILDPIVTPTSKS